MTTNNGICWIAPHEASQICVVDGDAHFGKPPDYKGLKSAGGAVSRPSAVRSVGFMNSGIEDAEKRKKKLNAELLGFSQASWCPGVSNCHGYGMTIDDIGWFSCCSPVSILAIVIWLACGLKKCRFVNGQWTEVRMTVSFSMKPTTLGGLPWVCQRCDVHRWCQEFWSLCSVHRGIFQVGQIRWQMNHHTRITIERKLCGTSRNMSGQTNWLSFFNLESDVPIMLRVRSLVPTHYIPKVKPSLEVVLAFYQWLVTSSTDITRLLQWLISEPQEGQPWNEA